MAELIGMLFGEGQTCVSPRNHVLGGVQIPAWKEAFLWYDVRIFLHTADQQSDWPASADVRILSPTGKLTFCQITLDTCSSLVAAVVYNQSCCGYMGVITLRTFSRVNKMMLMSLD